MRDYKNTPAQDCIELLREVLMEAFQTEAHLFSPPYTDLARIDHGFRSIMWPDFYITDIPASTVSTPEKRLFIIKSNLGFYNIIAYLTLGKNPDFISIGPFRSEEFTSDNFAAVIGEKFLPDITSSLSIFYRSLPYIPLSSVTSVTKCIIAVFYPEFADIVPTPVSFTEQNHLIQINTDLLQDFTAELAEGYQQSLFRFLAAVKQGEFAVAQKEMKSFLQNAKFSSVQNTIEGKRELNLLNGYCHMAVLETSVHPVYALRQYATLGQKIFNSNSQEALLSIPNEICHKYCLLVKNYAYPEFSRTIRDVINYIRLHLDENLSLALIAEHFHKNPASLSGSFSREVGISITDCIHKMRINEAIRYFNTTSKSVSEVALTVGFQDFAYFSRLFRRQIGCSPREYCRSIR